MKTSLIKGFLFLVALTLLAAGCVTYNAGEYRRIAAQEVAADTVDADRCEAHKDGAAALRDEEGKDHALKVPLGSGHEVENLAYRHDRQEAVCREYVGREDRTEELDGRLLDAWKNQWEAGSETVGGEF